MNHMDNQPVISLKHICFSYADREVLHNISFDIPVNGFIGVVGPNGGGKTTLLKLILGTVKPQRGTITVFGTTPHKARPRIGYVMQHMLYDPSFPATVLDIVRMGRAGCRRFGPYRTSDTQAALNSLELVDMAGERNHRFSELSGGQRQRVLIAQSLAADPQMLLLDEPMANIDIEGEKAIQKMLVKLRERMTIVLVSHNVNIVMSTVTHVLCVNVTAVLNTIDNLHPELIAAIWGKELAVLHHKPNCHVFDASKTRAKPHGAEEN